MSTACVRCNGTTKAGQPCRNMTCKYAPKCHLHTKVEIKQSPIAGCGLFAKSPIKKGEIIADYRVGTTQMTQQQFRAKYPRDTDATHAILVGGYYYDAPQLRNCNNHKGLKSAAGMINHKPLSSSNAKFTGQSQHGPGGKVKAKKNIRPGTEITVYYGRDYQFARRR